MLYSLWCCIHMTMVCLVLRSLTIICQYLHWHTLVYNQSSLKLTIQVYSSAATHWCLIPPYHTIIDKILILLRIRIWVWNNLIQIPILLKRQQEFFILYRHFVSYCTCRQLLSQLFKKAYATFVLQAKATYSRGEACASSWWLLDLMFLWVMTVVCDSPQQHYPPAPGHIVRTLWESE